MDIGLPQGSVLAPILFILYINDIVKNIKFGKIKLFADDALLYVTDESLEQAKEKMNMELNDLYKWLCMNKLKLNIDKTKAMIIGSKQEDIEIMINSEKIEIIQIPRSNSG